VLCLLAVIARDNIFYSALAGADRQQRHAPMTADCLSGLLSGPSPSSRSAASTGSSIRHSPKQNGFSRMRRHLPDFSIGTRAESFRRNALLPEAARAQENRTRRPGCRHARTL